MDDARIAETLDAAERAAVRGASLGPTGFWKVVAALKGNASQRERYAAQVAAIDTKAFLQWAFGAMPVVVGATLAIVATAGGLLLVALGYRLDEPGNWIAFLVGTGVLLGSTHAIAHLVVGRMLGIRFTHWYVAPRHRLVPGGVKIEYTSYLAASPRRRAWMHASGALVTKAIPFLLIGAAAAAGLPGWVTWALVALGTGLILSDLTLSTRNSDWKRFRREMAYARRQEP